MSLSTSSKAIRDSSNRLASLSFTSRPRRESSTSASGSSGSELYQSAFSPVTLARFQSPLANHRPSHYSHLTGLIGGDAIPPPRGIIPGSMGNVGRSALSMMMDLEGEKQRGQEPRDEESAIHTTIPEADETSPVPTSGEDRPESSYSSENDSGEAIPVPRERFLADHDGDIGGEHVDSSWPSEARFVPQSPQGEIERSTEQTPLLRARTSRKPKSIDMRSRWKALKQGARKITAGDVVRRLVEDPIMTLPSVILGALLNVLDGVSYGMILYLSPSEHCCRGPDASSAFQQTRCSMISAH